ncbi:MAG: hypothetical protein H7096_03525 [Flavobacterium sp.]|nr:hypothetical protein [Pedobacter sp.]
MNKIILTTSLLLVAVFTVAYLYFLNISAESRNIDKTLSLVPYDGALVFKIKNDKGIYDIFSDYKLFNAITGQQKQQEIAALRSIFFNSKLIFEQTLGQNIFLTFHPEADSVSLLWLMPLPKNLSLNEFNKYVLLNKEIVLNGLDPKKPVNEVFIKSTKRTFYLHINEGFLAASYSKKLLEKALDITLPKISGRLVEEINRSNNQNENSPATIFINYRSGIPFLSHFFKDNLSGNFSLLNNFNGIATLNMNFKSDALMFNGITSTDTLRKNYINLFVKQKSVKNILKRLVPANTSNFISYGVSNYLVFHRDLKQLLKLRKDLDQLNNTLQKIRNESGIDPDRDVKKLWSNEFISFQLSTQEKYGAIQLKNGRQMQFLMEPLSTEHSDNIRHISYAGLFYYYFGDGFKQFNRPFYTIIDNQMIISNSANSIRRYLNGYSKSLLFETEGFIHFDQLVADQSNISIFIHNKNSGSNIESLLKPSYASTFKNKNYGLKDFYGLSYQWSSDGDRLFTNFYAGYNQGLLTDSAEAKITGSPLQN